MLELVEAGRRTLVHVEIDAEALDGGVREIEAAHACDCAAADTNLAGELTHRQALRPQESVEREAGAAHPHLFHNVTLQEVSQPRSKLRRARRRRRLERCQLPEPVVEGIVPAVEPCWFFISFFSSDGERKKLKNVQLYRIKIEKWPTGRGKKIKTK